MSDFKSNKVVVDIVDMNPSKMLADLSYSPRTSNFGIPQASNQDSLYQGPPKDRLSNAQPPKDNPAEASLEKAMIYPSPQPSYNPNRCPPDLTKAAKHGFAHRVTQFQASQWLGEVCESTGMPIIFKQLGLLCSMTQLYFLGPVVPMYFLFIKQLGFLVLFLSCIPIAILVANNETYTWDYKTNMAIFFNNQVMLLIFCSFAAIIIFFFVMYMFRRSQKYTKLACKKSVIMPTDYTVMASNMGTIYTEEEVKAFFGNYIIPGFSLDLNKITLTYDIEQHINKIRKLKSLINQKREAEDDENYNANFKVQAIQNDIDQVKKFLIQNNNSVSGGKGLRKTGVTFVTFNTRQEAKSVRRKFEFSILEKCMIWILEKCTDEFPEYFFKENFMEVAKAPEVNEVLWENLNCNVTKKRTGFFNIILPVICFIFNFIILSLIRTSNVQGESYIFGVVIFVFNEAVGLIVGVLASHERFKTITAWNIALEQRTAFLQFVNSVVPIFILDMFVYPVSSADFSYNVVVISILIFFLPILMRLLNVPYLKKRLQRRRINHQIKTNSSSFGITQEEANHAYEDADFNVPSLYADNVKTFLYTCLFFSVSPGVAMVALIAFFLGFFVDKYNLLRKSLLPTNFRSEVSEAIFEFVDFGIFLLALGTNLLLKMDTNPTSSTSVYQSISIAGTILALVYLALPHKRFSRYCFPKKKKTVWSDVLFYQQATDYFNADYHTSNPVPRESKSPKQSQEFSKSILSEYKDAPDLHEAPDMLPLLKYAMRRPSLTEVVKQGIDGLRNPFYIFPQNYGYGAFYFTSASVLGKNLNAPLMTQYSQQGLRENAKGKGIVHEMVPSMANSLDAKDKTIFGSQSNSAKGNSIMKDIMLLPSFSAKSTQAFRLSNASNQKEDFAPSPDDTLNNEKRGAFAFSQSDDSAIIDGVSPITDIWIDASDRKLQDNPLGKRY